VYTVGALKGGDFMKYVDTSVLSEVFNIKKNAVYYRVKVGSLPEPDLIYKEKHFWKMETVLGLLEQTCKEKQRLVLQGGGVLGI
jgi:hypothetical protein